MTMRLKRGSERASSIASATAGDMGDAGDVLQMQFQRVADQQLVEPSVFAQNERIVEAGYQQDVAHPEGHEILECLEELFRIGDWLG